jgi:hypothetical protein
MATEEVQSMNRFSGLFRFRCARMVLAFLALSALMFCLAGCSSDPSALPFHEMVRKITGLRFEGVDPAEVTDARAVGLFKECLLKSEEIPGPPVDVTRVARVVTLRLGNEWEAQPHQFVYKVYPFGNPLYVRWGDKWYRVPGDFFAMAGAVHVYHPDSYAVDPGDEQFLKTHGWTPFFLVSTTTVDLPATLIHRPGDFPEVIYWAWNGELSKDVGLDLSSYLGKTVEARLYKTAERLPEQMGASRDFGRAVVVRAEGKIVGAWLDYGSHYWSLKGRTLEEMTGKSFDDWVTCLIDPADPVEQSLSKMSPEEVIETYYSAIDRKDYALAHACESRSHLILYLASHMSMDYRLLYNEGFRDESGVDLGNYISRQSPSGYSRGWARGTWSKRF